MRKACRWQLGLALVMHAPFSFAAGGGDVFRGADLELGARLIQEKKCQECHVSKFGGDGSAVYRPGQRIKNTGMLIKQVEHCNRSMKLGMSPQEVTAVAAVLQRDHYRFEAAAD